MTLTIDTVPVLVALCPALSIVLTGEGLTLAGDGVPSEVGLALAPVDIAHTVLVLLFAELVVIGGADVPTDTRQWVFDVVFPTDTVAVQFNAGLADALTNSVDVLLGTNVVIASVHLQAHPIVVHSDN